MTSSNCEGCFILDSTPFRFWWLQMIPAFACTTWGICLYPWSTRVTSTAAAKLRPASGERSKVIKCWLKNDLKWLSFSHFCNSLCPHSHDYSFIVSGSEDKYIYIWSTYHDLSKFTSVRRDRNDFWEGIKGDNALCVQGRMTFNLLKSKLS